MERNDKVEEEPFHEGQYCLDMIGLGHLAEKQIPGTSMQVRDFLDICGDQARPVFVGIENLEEDDPRRGATIQLARTFVFHYLHLPEEQ